MFSALLNTTDNEERSEWRMIDWDGTASDWRLVWCC